MLDTRATIVEPTQREVLTRMDTETFGMMDMTEEIWDGMHPDQFDHPAEAETAFLEDVEDDDDPACPDHPEGCRPSTHADELLEDDPTVDHAVDDDDMEVTFND